MRRAPDELTDLVLRTTKALPKGSRKLRDRAAPGLMFRVRANGRREFLFTYSFAGRRREMALGTYGQRPPGLSLSAARTRVAELRLAIRAGADPLDQRAAHRTQSRVAQDAKRSADARLRAIARGEPIPGSFADLAHCYIRDHARKFKRTWREDERKVRRDLLPAWGDRPASSIARADVRALVSAIAAGEGARIRPSRPAPVSANRTLALVSGIYAYGVDVEFPGVTGNPAYRLTRPAPEETRARVLDDSELRALWAATEQEDVLPRCAVRLLLLTGLRRGELLGARWSELVEDDLGLWLEVPAGRAKNNRPLRAPLSSLARETLAELSALRDREFLFPGVRAGRPLTDLKGPTRRLKQRVAVAMAEHDRGAFVLHDLRRTFRTLLASLRVPFGIAERCLGHIAPDARGVAGVYDRFAYAEERMAAVEALARRLRKIIPTVRAA